MARNKTLLEEIAQIQTELAEDIGQIHEARFVLYEGEKNTESKRTGHLLRITASAKKRIQALRNNRPCTCGSGTGWSRCQGSEGDWRWCG